MATHDDPHNDRHDDPRFGPTPAQAIIQFIWALLGDWRRIRALVFLLVVGVAALLVLKGSYAGVTHDLAQDVPHWFVKTVLLGSAGTTIAASRMASAYRKMRRAKLPEDRVPAEPGQGPAAQPVQKPPPENGDDGLGEPGED
jgi:hypothetical protein